MLCQAHLALGIQHPESAEGKARRHPKFHGHRVGRHANGQGGLVVLHLVHFPGAKAIGCDHVVDCVVVSVVARIPHQDTHAIVHFCIRRVVASLRVGATHRIVNHHLFPVDGVSIGYSPWAAPTKATHCPFKRAAPIVGRACQVQGVSLESLHLCVHRNVPMTHECIGFWCVSEQTRVGIAGRGGVSQCDSNAVVRAGVDAQAFIDRATSHDRGRVERPHGHGLGLFNEVATEVGLTGGNPPFLGVLPIVDNLRRGARGDEHGRQQQTGDAGGNAQGGDHNSFNGLIHRECSKVH